MPSPIEQALTSLLPTLSYLPPDLISLSNSLLAQSRSKASSLKPEEEIGRIYACCHIACERLGHRLALEIAKPTPPVKPKVYQKLHTYLNSVLKTTAGPRTPTGKRTENKLVGEKSGGIGTGKQSRKETGSAATTPASRKRNTATLRQDGGTLPEFAKPIIRHICKECNATEAIPHVFAGVSSILPLLNYPPPEQPSTKKRRTTKQEKAESIEQSSIPSLIIAVFLAVYAHVYPEADEITDEALEAWAKYDKKQSSGKERDADDIAEEVKRYKDQVVTTWSDMEWYQNIPTTSADPLNDGDIDGELTSVSKRPSKTPLRRKEKHGSKPGEEEDVGAAGLLPGLGTMFQPAVDWLSEERREEFGIWKREILREVEMVG